MSFRLSSILLTIMCLVVTVSSLRAVTVASPMFAPLEGVSATNLPVVITCATSGATIHYTLNGAEPTVYDPVITSGGTLTFRRSLTLKAKAWVGADVSPTANSDFDLTGDIAAGTQHVLGLKSNRQVFAWGSQQYGRLANGSTSSTVNVTNPGAFSYSSGNPVADAIAIASGYNQNVILKYDGTTRSPWCVGYGGVGELGNNDNANSTYPVRVVKSTSKLNGSTTFNDWLGDCSAVAAGQFFSGALGADGLVYTWGSNSGNGRLGNGSTTGMRYFAGPVLKAASTNLTTISAIEFGDSQGLALDSNHKVWAWGSNSNGQLGNGAATGDQPYAGTVLASGTRTSSPVDLTDVIDISTGDIHSAVVRSNGSEQGTVWTFGSKANGRLGNGATSGNTGTPTKVKTNSTTYLTNIVQVSAGSQHTLALDESKQVWAWGYNGRGALGNNTTNDSAYAVRVLAPVGSGDTYLSNIVRISTGGIGIYSFSIAVAENGTVYAWGANDSGQLANGTSSTSAVVKVPVAIGSFKVLPNSPDVTLAHTLTQSASPGAATLTATPSDADGLGNIQKVEFYSQGILVGTKTASPWTQSLTGLAAGNYYNYAIVTDNDGNTGYSQPSSFTIVPGDTDSDGLPDAWEISWWNNLTQTGSGDPDNDRITNAQEYALGTNPTSAADTDSDGLADDWERFWFSNITSQSGANDFDGDGLTNSWEYTNRTNPNTAAAARDADGDGLPDDWERFHFGDTTQAANGDFDGDTLTNLWEYQHLTNPNTTAGNQDSDNDGLPDDWEILYFTDLTKTAAADSDGDKISNAKELAQGTNPNTQLSNRDADSDGLPDDWEKYYFNTATQTGSSDFDADGLTNRWEFDYDTNPTTPVGEGDVDADGLPDDWERFWFVVITAYNGDDDPDEDLMTNAQEYSALLNPNTPALEKDADTDGLFDDWERYWFFRSITENGNGDFDLDNLSNAWEFSHGTNPNTPAAFRDSDVDSLPDDWEIYYFGNLDQENFEDPDGDSVINYYEFYFGTDPSTAADTDNDGLPDDWEKATFGDLSLGADDDPDGDQVSNLQEFNNGTVPNYNVDSDGDLLPDDWETHYFGDLTQDYSGDPDGDKISNYKELTQDSDPTSAADNDTDGLPDDWEIEHFGALSQDDAGDPDADKVTNFDEFNQASDPNHSEDADSDALPDDWETHHFGNLTQAPSEDPDTDKVTNLQEFVQGTDPNAAEDTDLDGLPDDWETLRFGNLAQTASGDPDADRLTNAAEFIGNSNPSSAEDTDNDGLPDDWERHHFGNLAQTATDDPDQDSQTNAQEFAAGSPPVQATDFDFDGLPDGWEIANGLDSNDASGDNGANGDPDLDGLSNFDEWLNGTSPQDADTDGDLVSDADEVAAGSDPLDVGDLGSPPPPRQLIEVPFQVGDPSGSHSEKWKMVIRGMGPDDHRVITLASQNFGVEAQKTFKLRKWNRYEIDIKHLATDPSLGSPDYDWDAFVDGLPTSQSAASGGSGTPVNNFFMVKDHWLADNRSAILTTETHGDDNNLLIGKKAHLAPIAIRDNETAT